MMDALVGRLSFDKTSNAIRVDSGCCPSLWTKLLTQLQSSCWISSVMIINFLLTSVLYYLCCLSVCIIKNSKIPCKMVVVWLIRPLTWH